MSIHTVRPLLQTQSEDNNNRLLADVLNSITLRTVEHYELIARGAEPTFDPDLDT